MMSVTAHTQEYLKRRAEQSGLKYEDLGVDPDVSFLFHDEDEEVSIPDNLFTITILFDGMLEEEFYLWSDYEINVADWLAEDCERIAGKDEDWEVIVCPYVIDDAPPVHYKVSSWDRGGN